MHNMNKMLIIVPVENHSRQVASDSCGLYLNTMPTHKVMQIEWQAIKRTDLQRFVES